MKRIVVEGSFPYIDELRKSYDILLKNNVHSIDDIHAIVFYDPDIDTVFNEIVKFNHREIKVIIISSINKYHLFKMLFPSSCVLDFRSPTIIDELMLALEERLTVKFDEDCFDEREDIYLSECAYGITLKEICTNMNLSERTGRRIQEKLLNKTGLVSSKQLVAFAISRKIIKTRRGEALLGKE